MFDVLMYLFETYIHSDIELMVDQDELAEELSRAGFHREEIIKALAWLERLADLQDEKKSPKFHKTPIDSIRVYTPTEMQKINTSCRGFLLFLEQINILTPQMREIIIERVMELDTYEIELIDLKWVIMMVLFNIPGSEKAYFQMEELIYDDSDGIIH